jgi:hypothetical protein
VFYFYLGNDRLLKLNTASKLVQASTLGAGISMKQLFNKIVISFVLLSQLVKRMDCPFVVSSREES